MLFRFVLRGRVFVVFARSNGRSAKRLMDCTVEIDFLGSRFDYRYNRRNNRKNNNSNYS